MSKETQEAVGANDSLNDEELEGVCGGLVPTKGTPYVSMAPNFCVTPVFPGPMPIPVGPTPSPSTAAPAAKTAPCESLFVEKVEYWHPTGDVVS